MQNTRVHTTLSGRRIEYTPSPPVAAFLERLAVAAEDEAVTEQAMIGLAYSTENPILDATIHPERGMVTKDVLADPAYAVMVDLLFRKHVAEKRVDVAELAARFSLTVPEAAARLGVHHTTIRQAINAKRIAAWTKDGQMYLDPSAVDRLEVSPRSPRDVVGEVEAPPAPLDVVCGHSADGALKLRAVHELADVTRVGGNVVKGTLREWKRVAVLTKGGRGVQRCVVLEPGPDENVFGVAPFEVRGRFTIAKKANGKAAAELYKDAVLA